MTLSSINKALGDWQAWGFAQEPKVLKRLNGGLNNSVFLIQSEQRSYVLKLFHAPMIAASQIQARVAKSKLAPAVIYQAPNGEYCVMDYLQSNLTDTSNVELIAHGLAKLHTLSFEHSFNTDYLEHFDYANFCRQYVAILDHNYQQIQQQIQPVLQTFISDSSPHCLCHNDLVRENCLLLDDQVKFIDWDYAQINNPWFDVASLVFYFELNRQQTARFIAEYQRQRGAALTSKPGRLEAALCAVIWLDIIWHAQRSVTLCLALDHQAQAQKLKRLRATVKQFEELA